MSSDRTVLLILILFTCGLHVSHGRTRMRSVLRHGKQVKERSVDVPEHVPKKAKTSHEAFKSYALMDVVCSTHRPTLTGPKEGVEWSLEERSTVTLIDEIALTRCTNEDDRLLPPSFREDTEERRNELAGIWNWLQTPTAACHDTAASLRGLVDDGRRSEIAGGLGVENRKRAVELLVSVPSLVDRGLLSSLPRRH